MSTLGHVDIGKHKMWSTHALLVHCNSRSALQVLQSTACGIGAVVCHRRSPSGAAMRLLSKPDMELCAAAHKAAIWCCQAASHCTLRMPLPLHVAGLALSGPVPGKSDAMTSRSVHRLLAKCTRHSSLDTGPSSSSLIVRLTKSTSRPPLWGELQAAPAVGGAADMKSLATAVAAGCSSLQQFSPGTSPIVLGVLSYFLRTEPCAT